MQVKKVLLSPWPLTLWTILIFVLLTIRTGAMESVPMFGIPNLDKIVHFILFGVMAFLWVYRTQPISWVRLILILLAVAAYGAGMEWVQENFTTREFDWNDIYADWAGAITGLMAGKKIGPYGNRGRNQN